MLIPVILSGGSGTRLRPLSRKNLPKQFLALSRGDATLFQQTVTRTRALALDGATILLEPMPRNTGPAIALAA